MGLLGLEKYPAFVAFKIFFHPDLNMIYQKKMTKRGSLRTSTSASVSIQRTFAHDDVAFRFVAKFEQHHYLLIIYHVHRCLFKRLCVQTLTRNTCAPSWQRMAHLPKERTLWCTVPPDLDPQGWMSSRLLQPCCNASNVALIFRSGSLFSPTRTPTVCTGTDFSTKKPWCPAGGGWNCLGGWEKYKIIHWGNTFKGRFRGLKGADFLPRCCFALKIKPLQECKWRILTTHPGYFNVTNLHVCHLKENGLCGFCTVTG